MFRILRFDFKKADLQQGGSNCAESKKNVSVRQCGHFVCAPGISLYACLCRISDLKKYRPEFSGCISGESCPGRQRIRRDTELCGTVSGSGIPVITKKYTGVYSGVSGGPIPDRVRVGTFL